MVPFAAHQGNDAHDGQNRSNTNCHIKDCFHMLIPTAFANHIEHFFGSEGTAWLAELPSLLEYYATRWQLVLGPAFANLSFNYVVPALRSDGSEVVLKLGVPRDELLGEAAALAHYAGVGSVRLLDADPPKGVTLLERLRPGTTLDQLGDDTRATETAIEIMHSLHRAPPPGHSFPSVADWAAELNELRPTFGGPGPFPADLLEAAEGYFAELLPSQAPPVVLHGDLHHMNIIADDANWRAIDPKGVVGEPAYEIGPWLYNPNYALLSWPDLPRITARRIDQFAEGLGVERERIRAWGIAQAILSAWWDCDEEGKGSEFGVAVARIIADSR
jgi:streptomycin 6-kinase